MSHLEEAISRYNKILETPPHRDLSWVKLLHERMEAERLSAGGRLLCPFLRPNFVTRRQYESMVKTGEALISAIERMEQLVLSSPSLLAKMQLLPAEKMLASVDPGYHLSEVAARFDLHLSNGTLQVIQYNADSPAGMAWSEGLADVFYDCPPVKEFRKRYHLTRMGSKKQFLAALLKAYKQFGGERKPNIAILEFRTPFATSSPGEYQLIRDFFQESGYPTEIVSPDQLEYRNGVLRSGSFDIHLIYRRISVQEFLMRFDLSHPLVQAYRDHAVCLVNSFRSEMAHKKALFGLLTDETLTAKFPAAERKAIRDHVPWTRLVAPGKTKYHGRKIDLLEFVLQKREKLVLKPNDDYSDQQIFVGSELDQAAWERALRQAQRAAYVVQEKVEPAKSVFPMLNYGQLEYREMQVDVRPQAFLGKVAGCSSWLSAGAPGSYSSYGGLAPTFILDQKD
ncbi:MAG TPA: circularly permuted type 2 ATP-grasp protein [Bryobacteraceae bacterium]|nr:circularly permuted type 2 ATP-grasp protein [Bryobacteraceae bacterium]